MIQRENAQMSTDVFPVADDIANNALINRAQYEEMYAKSINDPEAFWGEHGKRIDWIKPYSTVKNVNFMVPDVSIKWYEDGTLNASYNCIDRHLESVCIYMPMIPEAAYAMLACARIGAVHSIVFGGFSPDALAGRINDSECVMVITADEGLRGAKKIPLKANTDKALEKCKSVKSCIVVKRTGGKIDWVDGRDVWYHDVVKDVSDQCEPAEMSAEDPLFILYTSGSTGQPKGVLHTTGGYMVYASMTHEYVFDYHEGDVYWCTADVGWVTGHSYIVYGPLANGAITLMFEGVPNYPDASRFWQVCDKHQVNTFYTAPTAIRALMREGKGPVEKCKLDSLRLLGSVGEPINPEAWMWYHDVVGKGRCPIVDTWWQTETGGILITPLPGATDLKPGSATNPFFGVEPEIVDNEGNPQSGATSGNLCITQSWPGQMRTVYGDHERFMQTYFSTYKGKYFTGDGCRRDEDGYYWITGRVDDVINVSGHRKDIGPIASPDWLQWAPGLPKTRSGKIMRRILRKIAEDDFSNLGDTSTLADPGVVDSLIDNRQNRK